MTDKEQIQLYNFVGEKIKNLRKTSNVSQEVLANRLGLSRVSIVNIEKGRQHPSLHLLVDLAKIFKVRLDDFLPQGTFSTTNQKKLVSMAVKNTKESTGQEVDADKLLEFLKKTRTK